MIGVYHDNYGGVIEYHHILLVQMIFLQEMKRMIIIGLVLIHMKKHLIKQHKDLIYQKKKFDYNKVIYPIRKLNVLFIYF